MTRPRGLGQLWSPIRRRLHEVLPPWMTRHLPPVRIGSGAAAPAWSLRLVLVGMALGTAALVAEGGPSWVIAGSLAAAMVLLPGGVLPAVLVGWLGLLSAAYGVPDPLRTAGLLVGAHLTVQLGALLGQASLRARVELRSLAVPGRRVVAIQATAQPVALLAGWLAGLDITIALLPVLAGTAVAGLVVIWLPRVGQMTTTG